MKKLIILTVHLIFIIVSIQLLSKQSYPQEDGQLWLCTQIEYGLTKEIEFQISEEIRFYKNRSVLSQLLTDFGLTYKFTDFFKVGIFYRYRIMPDEDDKRNELFTNLTFKSELENLEINDRIRIHFKFRESKETINNLRNRLTIGYKFYGFLKPYLEAELFYRFLYEDGDRLTQGRYSIGIKSKLFKYHELDLFFMLEYEYNTNKAINSNIIGLTYTLNL